MNSLIREWKSTSRSDVFKIIPLGDVHIGARACDEKHLLEVVKRIKDDEDCYWIGMGDYADFVNRQDPRFSVDSLAKWLTVRDLGDLAKAQINHFTEIVAPIASRCLGLAEGNHETQLSKHSERDVYAEIVTRIKEAGKFKPEHKLGLGYYGWLTLKFSAPFQRNGETKGGNGRTIVFNVHHGFVNGKQKGAKALEMEKWLWQHDCDVVIFGHSHNVDIMTASVQSVNESGEVVETMRRGCYSGTFLRNNSEDAITYSEMKGYYPLPIAGVCITLRPRAHNRMDAVRIEL